MHMENGMGTIEERFEARVRAAIGECHQLGYHPHDFESMLASTSAVRVAEKLVVSGNIQTGLKRLAQLGRLDLSMEAMVLDPEFAVLFDLPLRRAAIWRLEELKRHPE